MEAWQDFRTGAGTIGGWIRGRGDVLAVCLHGGPGMTDYTESLADEVLGSVPGLIRVARFQQRGFEPSTTGGPFTVERAVGDVIDVLDALGAATAILVGHSWGAHLALHVAVTAPERVDGLVVLDSLGGAGDGGAASLAPNLRSRIGDRARRTLEDLQGRTELDPVERATAEMRLLWPGYFGDASQAPPMPDILMDPAAGEPVLMDALRLLGEGHLERLLPTIDVPSIHLIGARSPIDPDANLRSANLLRNSIVEVQEGVGHFAWLERPGSVATALRRLLSSTGVAEPRQG